MARLAAVLLRREPPFCFTGFPDVVWTVFSDMVFPPFGQVVSLIRERPVRITDECRPASPKGPTHEMEATLAGNVPQLFLHFLE